MKKRVRIYKAQDGGQPSVEMLGYPGAQQKQQLTEEQILQTVANDINQGLPNEAITVKLVNQMGLDPNTAQQYITYVNQIVQQQEEESEEEEDEDDEVETEVEDTVPTSISMTPLEDSSDLALEEDDELYDEDQTLLQKGGEYGDFVTDMYKQGIYNFGENITPMVMPEAPEFKLGGYKTKKGYVNNVMKLVKKQLDGQDKAPANDADPIGQDMRSNTLGAFISSIKREGNLHLAKEQAEQEYDRQMQEFQMIMTPQQEVLQNYIPEAQFGMFLPRGLFNRGRQARAFMGNPAMTAGMNPFVSKLDVRRSGFFGRPRQYSIEYNNPFQMMQGMPNFAGMFPGMFGKKTTKTPGRLITETKAKTTNAEATKEVAVNTPGNEATNKPEETVTTETSTTTVTKPKKVTTDTWGRSVDDRWYGFDPSKKEFTLKDKWGRSPGTEWYGFNPEKKEWTLGKPKKEYGGLVNNPMPDEYGNLQRFLYGGNDEFTEADMYGTNSIDTTDPYFKYGGLTQYQEKGETDENTTDWEQRLKDEKAKWEQEYMQKMQQQMYSQLNPTQFMGMNPMSMYNPFFGVNTKMKKGPFNTMTGQAIMGNPYGANTYIKSIDVKRSGLSGNPRKYTINYGNNLADTRNRPLASASTTPSTQGIKSFENQAGRQRPWYLGKKWETDFEDVARPSIPKPEVTPQVGADDEYIQKFQQSQKQKGLYFDEGKNKWLSESARDPRFLQYGGLHKFLLQAQDGLKTPVTQDERLMLPTISSQQAGKQLFEQSFEDIASRAKFAEQPENFSVTYKNKMGLGDQLKYGVQGADMLMQGATRGLNALDENEKNYQSNKNYDSTNLYAIDPSIDPGAHDANSGILMPSKQGNTRNSSSKAFGGEQDEFVYMTDEEIEEFIANGGELEFVDDEESEEY